MPVSAVKHFHDDLNRRVDVPEHPSHQGINSVREGKAKFLGKGNDGIVFDTNDGNVAKVTTSVPYNLAYFRPHGHAISDARRQAELNNQAISEGHDLLLPQEFIEHGEKGFTIMPKVETGTDLSKEQILAYREKLRAFHDAGWRLNDEVQHGVDADGNIRIFDTGALEKIAPGAAESSYGESQREHGDALLRQHGHFDDIQAENKLRDLLRQLRGPSSFVDAATQWQEMVDNGHDALPFLIDEAREALQSHQGNEMAALFEDLLARYESEEANNLLDERMLQAQSEFADVIREMEGIPDDEPIDESLDDLLVNRELFAESVAELSADEIATLAWVSRQAVWKDANIAGFEIDEADIEGDETLSRLYLNQIKLGYDKFGEPLDRMADGSLPNGQFEDKHINQFDTWLKANKPFVQEYGDIDFYDGEEKYITADGTNVTPMIESDQQFIDKLQAMGVAMHIANDVITVMGQPTEIDRKSVV